MKKRIASLVAAIALIASSAASLGCVWYIIDEPNASALFND